jgi:hypothetical protein
VAVGVDEMYIAPDDIKTIHDRTCERYMVWIKFIPDFQQLYSITQVQSPSGNTPYRCCGRNPWKVLSTIKKRRCSFLLIDGDNFSLDLFPIIILMIRWIRLWTSAFLDNVVQAGDNQDFLVALLNLGR